MKEIIISALVLLSLLVLLAVTPLAFLWSVNSLFGLGIAYELKNVVAAWAFLFVIRLVTRTDEKGI